MSTFVVPNTITHMSTTPRINRSPLEEFLPELDLRRDGREHRIDPREIHLEPVGRSANTVDTPLAPIVMDSSTRVQVWPMFAAALVGMGAAILAFAAFSQFAL